MLGLCTMRACLFRMKYREGLNNIAPKVGKYMSRFQFAQQATAVQNYNEGDLRAMFQRFTRLSWLEKEFDSVEQIVTIIGDGFRTTKAHYRDTNLRSYDSEDVCRTTMTSGQCPIDYIESRLTPYRDFGGKQEAPEKNDLTIKFRTVELTKQFLEVLKKDERIINSRCGRRNDYLRSGKPIEDFRGNIIVNDGDTPLVLRILVESQACQMNSVEQHLTSIYPQLYHSSAAVSRSPAIPSVIPIPSTSSAPLLRRANPEFDAKSFLEKFTENEDLIRNASFIDLDIHCHFEFPSTIDRVSLATLSQQITAAGFRNEIKAPFVDPLLSRMFQPVYELQIFSKRSDLMAFLEKKKQTCSVYIAPLD